MAVGAVGGLIAGLAYYAGKTYLSNDPCVHWDWKEALFWSGVGTGIGAILGSGVFGGWWVGTQLGWWGGGSAAAETLGKIGSSSGALKTFEYLKTISEKSPSAPGKAIFRTPGNASDALNAFGNMIDTQLVSADATLNRFWAYSSELGRVQLRLSSSPPETPVIDIHGFFEIIKFHFIGN